MKIAIDSDINGVSLKKILCEYFSDENLDYTDLAYQDSHESDYPDIAFNLVLSHTLIVG
ncbi:MAG: RpiB/LacA/LacB family sugar-phosphate isomerase [Phycisphaerae bacterium]|nr:RpiB/LacA/LacB family sugar-phosphate isomerase [Phycisphaerae bacterium]